MDWSAFLSVLKLDQIAYAGIVVIIIFAILTDRLVTRRRLDEAREERNDWKAAYMASDQANRVLMQQNSDLIDGARTTIKVVEAIPGLGGDSVDSP